MILSLARNSIRMYWFVTFTAAVFVGHSNVLNWLSVDSDLKPGMIDSILPIKHARFVSNVLHSIVR